MQLGVERDADQADAAPGVRPQDAEPHAGDVRSVLFPGFPARGHRRHEDRDLSAGRRRVDLRRSGAGIAASAPGRRPGDDGRDVRVRPCAGSAHGRRRASRRVGAPASPGSPGHPWPRCLGRQGLEPATRPGSSTSAGRHRPGRLARSGRSAAPACRGAGSGRFRASIRHRPFAKLLIPGSSRYGHSAHSGAGAGLPCRRNHGRLVDPARELTTSCVGQHGRRRTSYDVRRGKGDQPPLPGRLTARCMEGGNTEYRFQQTAASRYKRGRQHWRPTTPTPVSWRAGSVPIPGSSVTRVEDSRRCDERLMQRPTGSWLRVATRIRTRWGDHRE